MNNWLLDINVHRINILKYVVKHQGYNCHVIPIVASGGQIAVPHAPVGPAPDLGARHTNVQVRSPAPRVFWRMYWDIFPTYGCYTSAVPNFVRWF